MRWPQRWPGWTCRGASADGLRHPYPGFSECIRPNRGETQGVEGKSIGSEGQRGGSPSISRRTVARFPPARLSGRGGVILRYGVFEVEVRRVSGSTTPCFDKAGVLVCCRRSFLVCAVGLVGLGGLVEGAWGRGNVAWVSFSA